MTVTTPITAQAAMIESDALLAAIVRSSSDAIVSKDLNGIVMSWNPAARRIFGFTAEQMIGQSIRKLIPSDLQFEEDMILDRIKEGEQIKGFQTIRLTASGMKIPVSVTVSPVKDSNGTIIGASKIARDMRESTAIDERLKDTEQRLHMLADNISQFAWIADAEGYIFWYNRRWYDYTGTTLEDMKGWGWKAVHHPDHVDRVVERIQRSWDTGEEWEDVFPLRSKTGEYRWFLSRAMPVRNDQGEIHCWFGTNTDITEEREQREQIRLLMREVSHRNKNMLSMVQALARRTAPAEHPEFVQSFEERLRALAANQELLVDRKWTGVQMAELARTQLYLVEDLVESRVVISGPDILIKPTPAETISMALHELATNATKYGALSNDAGKVEISWTIEEDADGREQFTLSWTESGGPLVQTPDHEGFGSTVIRRVPAISLNAEVENDFRPEGLAWSIRCDSARVLDDE
ncbi:MAG: PAS domain S-box protein [Sphingobium sp.]